MLKEQELKELSCKLVSEPDNYMHSFRQNIALYTDRKGITLQEVADIADISLSTLKSFLYGNSKDCTLGTTIKLARAFNVSIDELVGAETITPETALSLKTLRLLPESFTHFVRWGIQFHYENLKKGNVPNKAIEVMQPKVSHEGNLILSNQMSLMDISDLSDSLRPKVFLGVKIPNDAYAPHFFENDILLIANDRKPMIDEKIIFTTGDNMWIAMKKSINGECNYYCVRNNKICNNINDITNIMGYVAKVIRDCK